MTFPRKPRTDSTTSIPMNIKDTYCPFERKIDINIKYANYICKIDINIPVHCSIAFIHVLIINHYRNMKLYMNLVKHEDTRKNNDYNFSPINVEVRFSFRTAWMTIAYLWQERGIYANVKVLQEYFDRHRHWIHWTRLSKTCY